MHILTSASIFFSFDEFVIRRIPREKNREASALAQQASGYAIVKKYFHIQKPILSGRIEKWLMRLLNMIWTMNL